jgi:hypothetical protein
MAWALLPPGLSADWEPSHAASHVMARTAESGPA